MWSQDFKEFVILLQEKKVKYLVVGGYAVGIHGHPRYTGDLDIWILRDKKNIEGLIECLADFGFDSFELAPDDFLDVDNIIQLGYPPNRIDLMTNIDGVRFEEAYPNRKEVEIDGLKIAFIGYQDLILNKKTVDRNRDKDDIENLGQ
jgi:predicted nucleotidyltransferase